MHCGRSLVHVLRLSMRPVAPGIQLDWTFFPASIHNSMQLIMHPHAERNKGGALVIRIVSVRGSLKPQPKQGTTKIVLVVVSTPALGVRSLRCRDPKPAGKL